MTNQQIYSLCGVITCFAGVIANSPILLLFAFICSIFSIREAWK
jgi:hypothetical protein